MGISYHTREELQSAAVSNIKQSDVLLDIGAGICPRFFVTPNCYICCEPFSQYAEKLRESSKEFPNSNFVILQTDWKGILSILPDRSVDTILLLDVIEHLEKEDGEKLLEETIRKAKKQVVLFTPLGFVQQHVHQDGTDAWGLQGGFWQEHRSGWVPDDFDKSWDIFICKDFHLTDNLNNPLAKPEGAFWAIKNIDCPSEEFVDSPNYRQENFKLKERLSSLNNRQIEILAKYDSLEAENLIMRAKLGRITNSIPYKIYRYLRGSRYSR